jgi:hypothetical protein
MVVTKDEEGEGIGTSMYLRVSKEKTLLDQAHIKLPSSPEFYLKSKKLAVDRKKRGRKQSIKNTI